MLWEGELMNCYKCGEKVNDEITLCPNCGTYLQATPELIQQAISNDQSAIESLYHIAYSNVYYTVHAMIKIRTLFLTWSRTVLSKDSTIYHN